MIFLELGALSPGKTRKDGSTGNPKGELTVFVEPDWRIEGPRSILCGSNDSLPAIERALKKLVGCFIEGASCYGHLPELHLELSGCSLRTFSAYKGQPSWSVSRWADDLDVSSRFGRVRFGKGIPNNSSKPTPLRGAA